MAPELNGVESFCRAYIELACELRAGRVRSVDWRQPCADAARERAIEFCADERKAAIGEGTLEYDADAARECVHGLARASCDDVSPIAVEACQNVFVGSLAENDTCDRNADIDRCGGGTYCAPALRSCTSSCRKPSGPSEKNQDADCLIGVTRCAAGLACVEPTEYFDQCAAAPGELPTVLHVGDPCLDDSQCPPYTLDEWLDGWFTYPSLCDGGFCRRSPLPGLRDAPCMTGTCGAGLACVQMKPTCVRRDRTFIYHGPCSSDASCGDEQCLANVGHCSAPQALGEPCVENEQCESGGYSFSTKRCVTSAQLGEPCSEFVTCAAGGCRDGLCVRLPDGARCTYANECETQCFGTCGFRGVGASCADASNSCKPGLSCQHGLCETAREPGERCDSPDACASGRCSNGSCVALGADNESCQGNGDCADGLCCMSDRRCHANGGGLHAPCTRSYPHETATCAAGLRCLPNECAEYDQGWCCTEPRAEGGYCLINDDCASGTFCSGGAEDEQGCQDGGQGPSACAPRRHNGETCCGNWACLSNDCVWSLETEEAQCVEPVQCE